MVVTALVRIFCRSIGGRVTSVEMSPDEAAIAVSRQPWTWSLSQRSFAPWPNMDYRGDPVPDPTIVDGKLDKAGIWNSVP